MIDGNKTYMLLGFGAFIILANRFIGVHPSLALDPNAWVVNLFQLGILATFRSALNK